jgi:hypothetical protein
MPTVCRSHSHVHPVADPRRLLVAVDAALHEVLGPADAGRVYMRAAETETPQVPLPQLVLMRLSADMPELAHRVLRVARRHYVGAAAAA